jgi:hypothetical protein
MAEEAVISEPVSTRWFPVQRENTGKFADFGLEIAKEPRLSEENSISWGTDKHRPASQHGIIELLNRRVERIHIGVTDNSWPNPLCANHLKKSLDQCLGCSRSLSAFVKADGIKPDRPWCHRSRISREAAKRLRPLSGRPSLGREGAVVLLPPSSKIRHHACELHSPRHNPRSRGQLDPPLRRLVEAPCFSQAEYAASILAQSAWGPNRGIRSTPFMGSDNLGLPPTRVFSCGHL